MLIAFIVLLTVLFWGGMVLFYYRRELGDWFDNRYGPESMTREEEQAKRARGEKRLSRWRWYG